MIKNMKLSSLIFVLFFIFLSPCYSEGNCVIEKNLDVKTLNHIKLFVRSYDRKIYGPPDSYTEDTKIMVSSIVCGKNNHHVYLVYFNSQGWCGSGGCNMNILEKKNNSFSIKGRFTIVQPPVSLLKTTHYNRPDIAVMTNDNATAVTSLITFNGKKYKRNFHPSPDLIRKDLYKEDIFSDYGGFYLYK